MATLLIVDDDKDNCEVLTRLLGRDAHEVVCANDGRQAIDILTRKDPDLIVLDIRMPAMDGIQFLAVIRSYLRWQHLPVIVVSGLPDEDRDRAAKHGVRHVFQKGRIDFDRLREVVRTELAGRNESAPGSAS